ncbi:MAG TPA: 23S rRNA (pseudouridine(1915)-N(3))-methyltransferase RlmH [Thermodesulfobacteriota bacterium]|nr:23S rRNA (pseudouridine(1915)-N(3))-methyltransferase RlmH [Thermodesulfobacteriota bacterium]
MRVTVLWVGKTRSPFVAEGIAYYARLLGRYAPLTVRAVRESPVGPKADPARVLAEEGERLLAACSAGARLVALDRGGRALDSEAFAAYIGRQRAEGVKELVFAVGGPLGLADAVLKKAALVLSLSPLTLTHEMARLVLLEQLYRAETILRGEPYHK